MNIGTCLKAVCHSMFFRLYCSRFSLYNVALLLFPQSVVTWVWVVLLLLAFTNYWYCSTYCNILQSIRNIGKLSTSLRSQTDIDCKIYPPILHRRQMHQFPFDWLECCPIERLNTPGLYFSFTFYNWIGWQMRFFFLNILNYFPCRLGLTAQSIFWYWNIQFTMPNQTKIGLN